MKTKCNVKSSLTSLWGNQFNCHEKQKKQILMDMYHKGRKYAEENFFCHWSQFLLFKSENTVIYL